MGNTTKPFIAIPCYGNLDVHFFDAWLKFEQAAKEAGFNYTKHFLFGDSLVSRARNSLTMEFLKSDCTHLLFVDSDLVFSLDHVKRVLSHDENIVGGFYPKKKQGDVEFVFNCLTPPAPMDERRLTPVKYIGTGFMAIKKCVFEKMISELGDELIFKVDCAEKIGFDFWKVGVYQFKDGARRHLSEDWYFCQMAIDLGFTVYGDNAVCLKHSGGAVYPLLTQERGLFMSSPSISPEMQKDVAQYDLPFKFCPQTILDIGANIGAFSQRCLDNWPKAAITAFEPVPDNFAKLQRNCPSVRAYNAAVRAFDGKDSFSVGKFPTTGSFHDYGEQTDNTIQVDCVTAASLPSCDLVKIDTEGCEVEIIEKLDLSKTAALVCEYHSDEDYSTILFLMLNRGFKQVGWTYFNDGLGLLKFAKASAIKHDFVRVSCTETNDSAAAAKFPIEVAA